MASPEEKAAFQAYEMLPKVAAGEIPVAALPESYGGRPTGTTRRAIRMQAEWDQSQQAALENQRLMQQMDLEQRRFTLSQRNQTLQEKQEARLQAAEAKAQHEALKVSEQADFALNEVLGGFDPTGNPIAGLDPDAPDYMQRRNDIIKRYPKAINDDAFKTAISTTDKSYFDKLNFDQQLQVQQKSEERMLGREERMVERQAEAEEKREKRAEERLVLSQERELDKAIREQRQILAGLQGAKDSPSKQKSLLESQNKLIDLRIEKAALRGLVFETEEEAEAANPPSGSTIYIDRKPFKVP